MLGPKSISQHTNSVLVEVTHKLNGGVDLRCEGIAIHSFAIESHDRYAEYYSSERSSEAPTLRLTDEVDR